MPPNLSRKIMNKRHIKRIQFYFRPDMGKAVIWEKKLKNAIKILFSNVSILNANIIPKKSRAPQLLIALGGDGTILEATQKFQHLNPLILGLNLGRVGFLASVRSPKYFSSALSKVLRGNFHTISRMLIRASIIRYNKTIFSGYALNEITIQNLLGMVDLRVEVENHPVQYIHGNGVLIATATGSTAYNLSAHGPIVMPTLECMIVTELLDHNLPTPSLVVPKDKTIYISVDDFREHKLLSVNSTGESADVVISADSKSPTPLKKDDLIIVSNYARPIKLISFDPHYFLKSIQDKFSFK